MILDAVGISKDKEEELKLFVPCVLRVISLGVSSIVFLMCVELMREIQEYQRLSKDQMKHSKETETAPRRRPHADTSEDNSTIKTQGAVLLQSMLKLPSPHYQVVLDRFDPPLCSRRTVADLTLLYSSIYAQSMEELIAMAHDVTASRVLDVILQSPAVTFKEKRKFVMAFIGHYHLLVDDRIGSRVGDNCWAFADPYLRVRDKKLCPLCHA